MSRCRLFFAVLLATFGPLLVACTYTPEGIEPVKGFDAGRYMGRWYEIARLDNRFERGLEQITAEYALQPDGTVKVTNRGFDVARGEWREAQGKAKFTRSPDVGALKVSFFGPFYGGYNVVDLDPEYTHSLVVGSNRSYLWILSRTPTPPREEIERLIAKAAALGFETDALIYVQHGKQSL
jgi:apolipoprotein D and lipocalin family protein